MQLVLRHIFPVSEVVADVSVIALQMPVKFEWSWFLLGWRCGGRRRCGGLLGRSFRRWLGQHFPFALVLSIVTIHRIG